MGDETWGNPENMEDVIHEFNWNKFFEKKSQVAHAIGSPGSGKTHLEIFIAYAAKHIYPVANINCGTEDTQGAFTPIFGGAFVSSKYSAYDHKRIFMRQILCKKEKCENNLLLSIIDDMASDKDAIKASKAGGEIVKAHKNGSQWFDELLIMGYQSVRDISEDIINSPSFVFIFLENEDGNRRKLHRHYFKTCVPEYKDFCKLMDTICGEKFTCLVVDLRKQSAKLSERVFYFKAPAWKWKNVKDQSKAYKGCPEGWRFGCKQFQEWSDQRWDPNQIPDFIKDLSAF